MQLVGIDHGLPHTWNRHAPWHVVRTADRLSYYPTDMPANQRVVLCFDFMTDVPFVRYSPGVLYNRCRIQIERFRRLYPALWGCYPGIPSNLGMITESNDDDPSTMNGLYTTWALVGAQLRKRYPTLHLGAPLLYPTAKAQSWGYLHHPAMWDGFDFIPVGMLWDRSQDILIGDVGYDQIGQPYWWRRVPEQTGKPVFITPAGRPFWRGTADERAYRRTVRILDQTLRTLPAVLGAALYCRTCPPGSVDRYQWYGTSLETLWQQRWNYQRFATAHRESRPHVPTMPTASGVSL